MRRVQLHLVTLLVLSFAAAGLLWLNVRCSPGFDYVAEYDFSRSNEIIQEIRVWPTTGWPKPFLIPKTLEDRSPQIDGFPVQIPTGSALSYVPLLFDAAVAIAILVGVACVSEWVLRQRKTHDAE